MHKPKRNRIDRHAIVVNPEILHRIRNQDSIWYESPDDIEAAVKLSEERARVVSWFRYQAGRRLTRIEREALDRYFFEQQNYRMIAAKQGRSPSSAHRAVHRALRKLRQVAEEEGVRFPG